MKISFLPKLFGQWAVVCSVIVILCSATILTVGNYNLISSVPVNATYLTTDFLKSAYIINDKNQIIKYDSTGSLMGMYNTQNYGELTSVDATSPFNVLAFYKDFATLVSLDMRMNAKRLYKLSSIGINNVTAACLSNDNYIWIYDLDSGTIKKITSDYEVLHESISLPLILDTPVEPNYMVESGELLYINIPDMGIVMFDLFGNYYTAVSTSDLAKDDLTNFQVVDHRIIFYNNNNLMIYDLFSGMPESIQVPNSANAELVRVEKGRLYMLSSGNLEFYTQVK